MTATVVSLASHLRKRALAETCKGCSPEFTCARHRLEQLRTRLEAARGTDLADEALTDALAVIDSIVQPAAAHDERTTR